MRAALRVCPALLLSAVLAWPETKPRDNVDTYSAKANDASVTLAADYYGRAAPGERTSYFTGHYLVIEVALYPAKGQRIAVRANDFRLIVNGKLAIAPATSNQVAYDARMSEAYASGVDTQLGPFSIPGNPRQGAQFPGDPNAPNVPNRPRAPDGAPTTKEAPRTPEEALAALKLEEGDAQSPVSGYLYFLWEQSPKKIKSLALAWTPQGATEPRLTLTLIREKTREKR